MQPENVFNAPIPGQSLTQDPEMRSPWENPPAMNAANQALDHFYGVVTSNKFIESYAELISEDKQFFVDELAVGMLQEGFLNGLYTPDTMVLLVEPLIILLVWAAAQLGFPVSFSTDSGYEDRTGFEELINMTTEDAIPQEPEEPITNEQEPVEEPPAAAEPPTVGAGAIPAGASPAQSPLVGGM